jgi:hypothetical protein
MKSQRTSVTFGLGLLGVLLVCPIARAQRVVEFPPAESKPPPPVKAPEKTQAGGEEVDLFEDFGPAQNKSQMRAPPPPNNLTVIYKIEYGEKLKYVHPDGREEIFEQWKSYESDALNLVTLSNKELKDGNNYQYATKPLASKGFDPVDIPILYMTGDYDFVFNKEEVENLRKFLLDGGTIIFNAARGRDAFSMAVARELRKVFPAKPLMRLPPDHAVFNARFRLNTVKMLVNGVQVTQPPEVYSIDIGTRAAAILVPGGLGAALNGGTYHPQGKHIMGQFAQRLGVNLVAYMLGCTEYGKFLAQQFPVYTGRTRGGDVFRYAQVRYKGSWDVNPGIQNTLLQGLKDNTGIDVDYQPYGVTLDDPQTGHFPLLFMTGHYDFQLSKEESAGLARYLQRGGMMVVTAAAGLKPFDKAFRRELKKAFPKAELLKLPPTHPLFEGGWNRLDKITFTPAALRDDPSLEYPEMYGLFIDGRLAILYSPYDVLSGLNRESNVYAKGVTPDDALRLAINLITYSLSH